jgi:predicted small metal-binding protein
MDSARGGRFALGDGAGARSGGSFVMAKKQYRQLGCLDVQPAGGCAFQVRAENDEEIMRMVADHAKHTHKMKEVPPEMAAKVKSAIKSVAVEV